MKKTDLESMTNVQPEQMKIIEIEVAYGIETSLRCNRTKLLL